MNWLRSHIYILILLPVSVGVLSIFIFQDRLIKIESVSDGLFAFTKALGLDLKNTQSPDTSAQKNIGVGRPDFGDTATLDETPFLQTPFWDDLKESTQVDDENNTFFTQGAVITRVKKPMKTYEIRLLNGRLANLEIVDFITVFDLPLYSRDSDRKIISFARKNAPVDSAKLLQPGVGILITFKTYKNNTIKADRILFVD